MILGLSLTFVILLGWLLAGVASRPADGASRRRDRDRRFRELDRHPDRVNRHDVANRLLAEGLASPTVERVLDVSRARRIGARTLWRWVEAHGPSSLVTVLDAGLAEATLLDHLETGTAPDWRAISVFADLAAEALPPRTQRDGLVDLETVATPEDLTHPGALGEWSSLSPDAFELRQFDDLPPILGPGLSPYRAVAEWDDGSPYAA
ncbi:MAG: hypothetical protein WBP61_10530 [Nocardioides sp.]